MCLSPKIPDAQPTPQLAKEADVNVLRDSARKNRTGTMTGGSLLTGPSGVAPGAVTTAKTSLLGG